MNGCSAAVMNAEGVCFSEILPMQRGQSEQLVPAMDRVMEKARLDYDRLELIAVTIGPGAFTGLRIGLSAARALGVALGIPVTGITTTEALARQYAPRAKSRFTVILETKREDFYVQFFAPDGKALDEPAACSHSGIVERLQSGDTVIGDACERFAQAGSCAATMQEGYILPDPCIMAQIALEQWRSGQLRPADPLYLREADVSQAKNKPRRIEGL